MIYIGNGIYSDATPNEYLQHYGVLGMKWGVHRARQHEKNLYYYDRYSRNMSRADAKEAYKKRMNAVKQRALSGKGTNKKVGYIYNPSRQRAKKYIKDYDKKREGQINNRLMTGTAAGITGFVAGTAAYNHFNARARGSREIASGKATPVNSPFGRSAHKEMTDLNNSQTKSLLKQAGVGALLTAALHAHSSSYNKRQFGTGANKTKDINSADQALAPLESLNKAKKSFNKNRKKKSKSKSGFKIKTSASLVGEASKNFNRNRKRTNAVLKKAFFK